MSINENTVIKIFSIGFPEESATFRGEEVRAVDRPQLAPPALALQFFVGCKRLDKKLGLIHPVSVHSQWTARIAGSHRKLREPAGNLFG